MFVESGENRLSDFDIDIKILTFFSKSNQIKFAIWSYRCIVTIYVLWLFLSVRWVGCDISCSYSLTFCIHLKSRLLIIMLAL